MTKKAIQMLLSTEQKIIKHFNSNKFIKIIIKTHKQKHNKKVK